MIITVVQAPQTSTIPSRASPGRHCHDGIRNHTGRSCRLPRRRARHLNRSHAVAASCLIIRSVGVAQPKLWHRRGRSLDRGQAGSRGHRHGNVVARLRPGARLAVLFGLSPSRPFPTSPAGVHVGEGVHSQARWPEAVPGPGKRDGSAPQQPPAVPGHVCAGDGRRRQQGGPPVQLQGGCLLQFPAVYVGTVWLRCPMCDRLRDPTACTLDLDRRTTGRSGCVG